MPPAGLALVAPAGLFFAMDPNEPRVKRAVAFYDGQNLYRHAKEAFGHYHPNYDPIKLFNAVCAQQDFENNGVRFYTGTPLADKNPMWHAYWSNRLLAMRRAGISVTQRNLRYRQTKVPHPDGSETIIETPQEKGIDVRLALDIVRLARGRQVDVAVIFSQDQDLSEVVDDIREIAHSQNRWIKLVSAYPVGPEATTERGINGTDWFKMDQAFYEACLDMRDYRPKRKN